MNARDSEGVLQLRSRNVDRAMESGDEVPSRYISSTSLSVGSEEMLHVVRCGDRTGAVLSLTQLWRCCWEVTHIWPMVIYGSVEELARSLGSGVEDPGLWW